MCSVTRKKLPKQDLVRFVWLEDENKAVLDDGKRLKGRGANMQPSLEVFDSGINNKALSRAFKKQLSDENLSELRNSLEAHLSKNPIKKSSKKKKVVRISSSDMEKIKNKNGK